MREMRRTLTIRFPILAISITAGCAFNFGQLNASGTANVTADTKIDTTVNASTSVVAATPGSGEQQQTTTPSPVPSTVPMEKPKGKLFVYQNFSRLDGYGGIIDLISNQEIFLAIFSAKEQDIPVTKIRLTRIGEPRISDAIYDDFRLSIPPKVIAIPGIKNRTAEFSNPNGLFIVPKDQTVGMMSKGGIRNFFYLPNGQGNEQLLADYNRKEIGFSIKASSDIETLNGAEIIGSFPLNGPLFKFCCYAGDLAPNPL